MHNYALYFEFSGIFLIFLGPTPRSPPKRIKILSALVFGPGSITPH